VNSFPWFKRLLALLLFIPAFFAGTILTPREPLAAQQIPRPTLTEIERLFSELYTRVSPSVVSISVEQRHASGDFLPWNAGTGFVIDRLGNIVTNFHVVEDGDRIAVNFLDGTIILAEMVAYDLDSDIAVINVDLTADRLFPVTFGDSEALVIGQTALAIGSPFRQHWTLTSGIISALDRDIDSLGDYQVGSVIQTDAPINPGNSGGPLLNLRGEVIGVNTEIISRGQANSGVGFALPSRLVQRVVDELIADGEVAYSSLGIRGHDVSLLDMEVLDLPDNLRGVVVDMVLRGDAAERGGLRANSDVITAVDGVPVMGVSSLIGYLAAYTLPGDAVRLTIFRGGELVDVEVVLDSRR
jgi:S1-C subfamily serine protease